MPYKYRGGNGAFFINPYSFVPAGFANELYDRKRKNMEEQSRDDEKKHSGVLHCKLYPRTPLAVPDTASPAVFDTQGNLIGTGESQLNIHLSPNEKYHYGYHFMRDPKGIPMIPGSTIRGVVRSVYEAATDSCFSTSQAGQSITYRTRKQFSPGLLHKNSAGDYELYEAERYIFIVRGGNYAPFSHPGAVQVNPSVLKYFSNGQHVWFDPLRDKNGNEVEKFTRGYPVGKYICNMSPNETAGWEDGYFCLGEPFSRKHFESIFKIGKKVKIHGYESRLEKAVSDLDTIIEIYNDKTVNINARGGNRFYQDRHYSRMKPGDYLPVWYQNDPTRKMIYLSVAAIGRSAYQNTMGTMLGSHAACINRKAACPACRLFGLVGGTAFDSGLGTRVRISDATMQRPVPKCDLSDFEHLRELAGPKTSYMPFYLRNRTPDIPESWSYDSASVTLSGRKFYWHNVAKDAFTEKDRRHQFGERNSSMELIGPEKNEENEFSFDVYFDDLTEIELRQLIWVLTLGENETKSRHCHKIGHGKPIGLGSAKITVESGEERDFSKGKYSILPLSLIQYQIRAGEETQDTEFDRNAIDALRVITNLDACRLPVTYPAVVDRSGNIIEHGNNSQASHQWFSYNYKLGDRKPKQKLPGIGSQNSTSSALRYIEQD